MTSVEAHVSNAHAGFRSMNTHVRWIQRKGANKAVAFPFKFLRIFGRLNAGNDDISLLLELMDDRKGKRMVASQ